MASHGTGSSLGEHRGWIKVSGFVISHRRDQEKEASVQAHKMYTAEKESNVSEDSGRLRHVRVGNSCDVCPGRARALTTGTAVHGCR